METAQNTCAVCGTTFEVPVGATVIRCPGCGAVVDSTVADVSPSVPEDFPERDASGSPTLILPVWTSDETIDKVFQAIDAETIAPRSGNRQPLRRTHFDRFEVRSCLGEGAFGTVYRAHDPLLDRDVALKVPRFDSSDPRTLERFQREAKAAARLHHPNIVTLFENGLTDEGPYLVSEFVEGETLAEVIRQKRFVLREAVDWIRQIAEALHYAHSEHVVHRDIKPGNIMINRTGRPQIMDFGLAKRVMDQESNVTLEGQIVGTPNYMAPEQAQGLSSLIGAHSDQYSVGVVLYELLCGTTPYIGAPMVVLTRVGNPNDLPPTPRSLRPEIPRDLEACCLKAIEKEPGQRYPSLQAMADDLDHWLKGLPLKARPLGVTEQLIRWYRKNRLVASLSGMLTALLVVLAIVGPWLAIRFKSLAEAAERDARAANRARERETAALIKELNARLDTERVLIDNYTEFGLAADRRGDPRLALLYFANAVDASRNHPDRERHNRVRVQSWLPQIPVPIHAFPQPLRWNKHLSYHPSGSALLALSESASAEWIDLTTGRAHPILLSSPITAVTWSPDGRTLAAAAETEVALLSHPEGEIVQQWQATEGIHALRFSADGRWLVQGGSTSLQVRDVMARTARPVRYPVDQRVLSLDLSPDGRYVAARTDGRQIHVYGLSDESGEQPVLPVQSADSEGEVLPCFVSTGGLIVADGTRQALLCWDLETRQVRWQTPIQRVLAMAVSSDRRWVAAADNSIVLLLDTTAPAPRPTLIKHRNLVYGLAFDPQSQRLVSTGNDQSVQVYSVPGGQPIGTPIPHNKAGHRCVWSPDGSAFATVNWGGELIRVWQTEAGPTDVAAGETGGPFVRCHPQESCWLVSGFDGHRDRQSVEIVDGTAAKQIVTLPAPGLISDADFIPGTEGVVVVGGPRSESPHPAFLQQHPDTSGFVQILAASDGKPLCSSLATPSQPVAVRVSQDGTTAVVLCHRGHVLVLDPRTGQVRASVTALQGREATHGYVIRDRIRISPQSDCFAVWGHAEVVEIRDLQTAELRFELPHRRDFVHDVRFSPDGRWVASCSSDHSVCLWDAGTGKRIGEPLEHPGWIFSAEFSSDGRSLITACDDRHARVWDLATGALQFVTQEHPDQVFGVSVLPGKDIFLSCDRSGQLAAWEMHQGKQIAPPRRLPGMVYQLTLAAGGEQVIASGRLQPCRMIRWRQWIREPDVTLSRTRIRQLGELVSGQHIHEGGAVANLTAAEWLARWNEFHESHSLRTIASDFLRKEQP